MKGMSERMSKQDMSKLDASEEDFGDILDEFDLDRFDLDRFDLDSFDLDSIDLDDVDFLDENEKQKEKKTESQNVEEITGAEEELLSLFNDVDGILNATNESMNTVHLNETMGIENVVENSALEEFLGTVSSATDTFDTSSDDIFAKSLFAEEANTVPQEDEDVLKILEGLEGIDLELEEDMPDVYNIDAVVNSTTEVSAEGISEKKKDKKQKKKTDKKDGFWSKLSLILFGEDDEEDDKKVIIGSDEEGGVETIDIDIAIDDADNLALFGEAPSTSSKEEKGKKKKEKKEKKEKVKKEKPKKEKKPKPKKEKKPKPPKEPDNTPPLPKKQVFLILFMAASMVALILMGTNLLGYANQMNHAKQQYAKQNYSVAFAEISGMQIKEEDLALYEKYHVMAMVSTELEAYETLMDAEIYDMALDCLIRTIGRAKKYRADAEFYGCVQELDTLENEAEAILGQVFGVSKERALVLYASKTKEEYSYAIKDILKELGMEKVSK